MGDEEGEGETPGDRSCVDCQGDEEAVLLPGKKLVALSVASQPERMKYGRAQAFFFTIGFVSRMAMAMSMEPWPLMITAIDKELKITSAQGQFLGTSVAIGMMLSAFAGGLLADRFGRRNILIASVIFTTVMNFAAAAVNSYSYLLILQILKGVGFGVSNTVSYVLTIELMPLHRRGLVMMLWHVGWPCGALVAISITSTLLPSYRLCIVVSSIGGVLISVMTPFMVESPRYLATRGFQKEALRVVRTIERWNRVPPQDAMPEPDPGADGADEADDGNVKGQAMQTANACSTTCSNLSVMCSSMLRTSVLIALVWSCIA